MTWQKTCATALVGLFFTSIGLAQTDSTKPVKMSQLPAAVRETIKKQAAGGKILGVEFVVEEGKEFYAAGINKQGQEVEVLVGKDGKLISENKMGEENETTVSLSQVPEKAKAALEKASGGSALTNIVKSGDPEEAVYEAEFSKDGVKQSATVTKEGNLIETERDVKASELSPAVVQAIKKKYPRAEIQGGEEIHPVMLDVKIMDQGKKREIHVDPFGRISSRDEGAGKEEEIERE